jgi:trigger factor
MSTAAPQIQRTDLNEATVQLDFVCTPDQVKAGIAKALKKLGKKVRVPGFRPGLAPAALVENAIGEPELLNAAIEEIVTQSYRDAVNSMELKPVGQPSVDLTKFTREPAEMEFTMLVPLPPVIDLGDYKGIPVNVQDVAVTDEDVEKQIEELRRREGKQEKVADRGIQEGDYAVLNVKVEGEEGDGRSFMIIAGQTFPEMDAQIMGMHAEEIKQAELSFPENFQEKDWAGQTKKIIITVRSVSAILVPELDDNFAQKLKTENVDDLKEKVRASIQSARERMQADMINEQLLDGLATRSRIVVSDTTWKGVAQRRLSEMAQELRGRNLSLEDYAKSQNMTPEDLQSALENEAKLHVERAVMIEQVFRKEEMQITDEEANAHLIDVLIQNQVTQDGASKFLKDYGAQVREEVIYRTMHSKVLGFLAEHAEESAAEAAPAEEAAKAPAKKASKKKA